ncbi:MAG: hypothetical protein JRG76_00285 [Deltaproteobacteria bacterium]|nr:hypothetical protein [Deltaproteobacteria bacterium]MBW2412917.1 hypothetical protein [Deltaproteobacteria bacterium]
MTDQSAIAAPTMASSSIAAQLAASLPAFDPDERRNDRSWWLIILSLALHLALLLLFWDVLLDVFIPEEETVEVRMLEERPEPPKPKILARRILDSSVKRFKNVVQPKVQQLKPVPEIHRADRVEVERMQITEAPKEVVRRKVDTTKVSAFAEVVTPIQPIEVDQVAPTVRRVSVTKASAGPRKLEASGPITNPRAADVDAPEIVRGVASDTVVDGDLQGAKINARDSGTAESMLHGDGDRGSLPGGVAKDCRKDPVCLAYLRMIRDRVYSRWNPPVEVGAGTVDLRFRIDRGGSAHGLKVVRTDGKQLGSTCLQAFRHASPFPPPPKEIHYIITQGLVATFTHGND